MSYINLRKAVPDDVDDLLRIKKQLPLMLPDGTMSTGGFLLGTTAEQYFYHILNDQCLVAEIQDNIVGFGIMLYDTSIRNSDIWMKRHRAAWNININDFENERICYFEQLAFLPGHSRAVLKLAYRLVYEAFASGHHAMFTTTVHKPVVNLAAVPYILKGGGKLVGNIDEEYPDVGPILSDIYLMGRKTFEAVVPQLFIFGYLQKEINLISS